MIFEHALRLLLLLAVWAAPLPFCAWLVGRDRKGGTYGHDLLLVSLLWIACQTSIPLALGAVGLLHAPAVYAAEASMLLVGVLLLRLRGSRPLRWSPGRSLDSWELGFAFVALVVAGISFWSMLRTPTANYDSFAYHLPAMVWWAQDGRFEFLPDLGHAAYYAFDWEVASLLSIYPLRSDLFIAAPNLLVWAMLGLAIVLLARRLGARPTAGAAAALLVLTMNSLLGRLDAAQPDLAMSAVFVTAIYLGLVSLTEGSAARWGFCLLAVAMLPGLKMSGLVYAPMALIAIYALAWVDRGTRPNLPWDARRQAALCVWALFLGGFWYVRNYALNGNPFGFLGVELFGHELLQGEQSRADLTRTTLLAIFDPARKEHWSILLRVLWDNLGPGFVALSTAAPLALGSRPRGSALVLSAVGLWAWFAYWSAPYSGDNGSRGYEFTSWFSVGLRYGYPCIALLAVGAALGLTRLRIGARLGLTLVMGVVFYLLVFRLKSSGMAIWWSVGTAFVLCSAFLHRGRLPRRATAPVLAAVGFLLLVYVTDQLAQLREEQRVKQYGFLHAFMEDRIGPEQVVGYARTHRRYQLFGKDLQREVLCVDAQEETVEEWLQRLKTLGIDVLAVGTADNAEIAREGLPDVRGWIAEHPGRFEMLFPAQSELKDLALYRLR